MNYSKSSLTQQILYVLVCLLLATFAVGISTLRQSLPVDRDGHRCRVRRRHDVVRRYDSRLAGKRQLWS